MSTGPFAPTIPPSTVVPNLAGGIVTTQFILSNEYASQAYGQVYSAISNIQGNLADVETAVLTAWLVDAITNGGTGLSVSAQQDLWDLEVERNELAIARAKNRKARDWAKGAWALGDGILEAALLELDMEYLNRDLDRSRTIRVESEKLAIANIHFAVQRYTELAVSHEAVTEKAYESIAQTAAQVAAGALSAAHAQASVGFSSGYDVNNNISSQIQGSYSHDTKYDADA